MENTEIETLDIPVEKFDSVAKLFGILRNAVFSLLVSLFYARKHKREILDMIRGYDCIYLYGNWWSVLFPKEITIVGSQHTDFGFTRMNFQTLLKVKLINYGFLYRKIRGFHLFPHSRELMTIKGGNNFLLPPLGVDSEIFRKGVKTGAPRFIFVSRLVECKGVEFVISMWKNSRIESDLYIVGAGELSDLVQNEVKGVSTIKFLGTLGQRELADLYSTSDVLLAPTACDNYPVTVIEALMSGCNILASDHLAGIFDDFQCKGYLSYLPLNKELWLEKIREIERHERIPRMVLHYEGESPANIEGP